MNTDYRFVEKLLRTGGILGLSPTCDGIISTFRKVYCLILITLSIVGTVLSLRSRYSALFDLNMKPAQVFLESCECVSELCFMLACFIGVVVKGKYWKTFVYYISKTEEELRLLGFRDTTKIYRYILRVFVFHAMFLAIQTYEMFIWIQVEGLTLQDGYIFAKIVMCYQFFTAYVVVHIILMLKNRYMFLNNLVKEILARKCKMVMISAKDDKRVIIQFARIENVYVLLYNTVRQINKLYGWMLFFYFTTYILSLLGNLNYGLKYINEENVILNETIAADYIVYTTFHTVSTVVIVMSCDGVEQCGKKVAKTCFLYREILEKPSMRDDLMLFAKFAKQLAPKFSAAGFFRVNQSLLATLFSAVTTYLIIIIQFNMTL